MPSLSLLDRRSRTHGFTLIELMIAVCIIGVLSSVALPTYQRFTMEARSGEAVTSFASLYRGASSYWHRESADKGVGSSSFTHCAVHEITADWSGIVPNMPLQPYKRSYDYAQHESYRALGFSRPDPGYYSHAWDTVSNNMGTSTSDGSVCNAPDGPIYLFYALSDMDGDGIWGVYTLKVTATNGELSRSGLIGDLISADGSSICPFCVGGAE